MGSAHLKAAEARGAMIRYMRAHRHFTAADVLKATGASSYQLDHLKRKLRKEGTFKECGRRGAATLYTIMDAAKAAEFNKKKRGTKEGAIWTVMRSFGTFTPHDIMMSHAGTDLDISEDDIRTYCQVLLKAEYLAVVTKARPNVHPAKYRLVRNTGPLPPVVRTLQVLVDGNKEKAVWAAGTRL